MGLQPAVADESSGQSRDRRERSAATTDLQLSGPPKTEDMMANFPPTDLLQSGYAFRKLIELVEKTKHGDFS
jgi:hypothetical protein